MELTNKNTTSELIAFESLIILATDPSSILPLQTGQPGFIHSITTTLPLKSDRLTSLPAESFSVKAGAGEPTLAASAFSAFFDSFLVSCEAYCDGLA